MKLNAFYLVALLYTFFGILSELESGNVSILVGGAAVVAAAIHRPYYKYLLAILGFGAIIFADSELYRFVGCFMAVAAWVVWIEDGLPTVSLFRHFLAAVGWTSWFIQSYLMTYMAYENYPFHQAGIEMIFGPAGMLTSGLYFAKAWFDFILGIALRARSSLVGKREGQIIASNLLIKRCRSERVEFRLARRRMRMIGVIPPWKLGKLWRRRVKA